MKKSTLGIILASVSVGGLVFLYMGYYKPRQEAFNEAVKETKK